MYLHNHRIHLQQRHHHIHLRNLCQQGSCHHNQNYHLAVYHHNHMRHLRYLTFTQHSSTTASPPHTPAQSVSTRQQLQCTSQSKFIHRIHLQQRHHHIRLRTITITCAITITCDLRYLIHIHRIHLQQHHHHIHLRNLCQRNSCLRNQNYHLAGYHHNHMRHLRYLNLHHSSTTAPPHCICVTTASKVFILLGVPSQSVCTFT